MTTELFVINMGKLNDHQVFLGDVVLLITLWFAAVTPQSTELPMAVRIVSDY